MRQSEIDNWLDWTNPSLPCEHRPNRGHTHKRLSDGYSSRDETCENRYFVGHVFSIRASRCKHWTQRSDEPVRDFVVMHLLMMETRRAMNKRWRRVPWCTGNGTESGRVTIDFVCRRPKKAISKLDGAKTGFNYRCVENSTAWVSCKRCSHHGQDECTPKSK